MKLQGLEENPFLNFRLRSLLLTLLLTFPIVILIFWLSEIQMGYGDALVQGVVSSVWFYGTVFLCINYQFKRNRISWRRLIGDFPKNFNWFGNIGLLLCMLFFNFGSLFLSFGLLSFVLPDFVLGFMNEQENTKSFLPAFFPIEEAFVAILIAPFIEEVLMRGVFLHRLQLKWGINKAIIIGSLIFAVGHANILGMFMVALIMSLLYLKYKTLLVPIFFHAMNNAFVSLLQLIGDPAEPVQPLQLSDMPSITLTGAILIVITSPVLIYFLKNNWPKSDGLVLPYLANEAIKK